MNKNDEHQSNINSLKVVYKTSVILSNDNTFEEYRELLEIITRESNYADKSAILTNFFKFPNKNVENIIMWCRLLLPEHNPMIKYMNIKKLVNLFSKILVEDASTIFNHIEQSNSIDETIAYFYNRKMAPPTTTTLTIEQVNNFFLVISKLTEEDGIVNHWRYFLHYISCTIEDLKCIVKLINHNLKIGLAPKHIFEAIHPDAYSTFLSCNYIVLSLNKCFPKLLTQVVTKPKSNLDKLNNLNNSDQFPVNINIKGFEKPHASKHREETKSNKTEKADTTKIPRIILRNDNTFEEFREFIVNIQKEKYLADKSALLTEIFKFGSHNVENVTMWCMLLLPEQNHMIKYMNIDQLVKLFSRIFVEDASEIYNHLEKSNGINESIAHFYNEKMDPPSSTTLTIEQVNEFFYLLSQLDKKDEQVNHIKKFLPSCTVEDVNCIVKY